MKFHSAGRANAVRLLVAATVLVGGLVVIQKDHWFVEGHNGIYVSLGFMFTAALIIVIRHRRDPRQRAALVALFKDQKAMTFGAVWALLSLVTQFASHGFHDIFGVVIQALIGGFAVATIWNWFSRRRSTSNN